MHPNPAFRTTAEPRDLQFLRDRGFGTLAINGDEHPLTSHIPFLLNKAGDEIELHLVRSNPIVAASKIPVAAVLTCLGPDGYVSPDWYQVDDQVPTWNYVSVRVTGTLERLSQGDLHPLLDRLSEHFETRLPKTPWTSDKMSDGVMDRMMRMIVPYRMTDLVIEGTWKLSQNKDDSVRINASNEIAEGIGSELQALATLMKSSKQTLFRRKTGLQP